MIAILRRPLDTPELVVRVSRHIEGPVEIQEHKHDEVEKIWSPNPLTMLLGWFGVGAFPFYFVGHTLSGNPGTAFSAFGNAMFMALGFNPPKGWEMHERAETSNRRVTSSQGGSGITQVPWPHAWLEVNIADIPPVHPAVDSAGQVTIDLRKYPISLNGRQEDLTIKMWTEISGTKATEEVLVSPTTMAMWQQEQDKRERLEQARQTELQRTQEYERLHPEVVAARKAQEEATKRQQLAEATLRRATERAERQYEQCTSPCTNQSLICTASCLADPKSYDRCSLSCSAATESCTSRCEQQRDAQIVAAGGEAKQDAGKALLSGIVVASNAFVTAMEGKRSPEAGDPSHFSTFPGARSGNSAFQQDQSAVNGLPSSGTSEFPTAATSPNAVPNHSCPTSLAHLATQLPQYDVPDLKQVRSAILQLSTTEMYQRMLAQGITPANGAKMAIQDAKNMEQQREIAKQCVRQTSANPESVISSLERGTYRSPNRAAAGVLDGCAQGYVLMHYQAVATKAAAVAIACMARQ